ncbi:MAG: hypothetical protein ACHQHN_04110 [Sphingobacteriales bacterium]
MQIQVDISFDELMGVVKKLPRDQFLRLKTELEKQDKKNNDSPGLESFLLEAPTFSEKQLEEIALTRKAINKWRTKGLIN